MLTVKNYYSDLKMFLRFYKVISGKTNETTNELSKVSISDVTEADICSVDLQAAQQFMIFLKDEKNNGQKARYRKAVTLRQFYKFLTNNKHLFEVSPLANLELPSPKPALPKYLTLEQSIDLLSLINTPDQRRDYCIVTFFLNCGLRLSELVGINMKDIRETSDSEGERVYSLKVLGKGSKERVVYLNAACISAYKAYLASEITDPAARQEAGCRDMSAQTDALFISRRRTRISNRRVQQIVEDCFKSCGLDNMGFSVHKLRHTAATLMYQSGVDVRVMKDVLGHENLNTTQIYTHVSNAQIRDAIAHNPLANVHAKKERNDE